MNENKLHGTSSSSRKAMSRRGLVYTRRLKQFNLGLELGDIIQPKLFSGEKYRLGDTKMFHEFVAVSPNCFGKKKKM